MDMMMIEGFTMAFICYHLKIDKTMCRNYIFFVGDRDHQIHDMVQLVNRNRVIHDPWPKLLFY